MTAVLLQVQTLPTPTPSPPAFGGGIIGVAILLTVIIWSPVVAALVVALGPDPRAGYARYPQLVAFWVSIGVLILCLLGYTQFQAFTTGVQFEERLPWLPEIGAGYHLGVDGVGMTMLVLGGVVSIAAIVASGAIRVRTRAYFSLLLLVEAAFNGAVSARDLFVLLLFWSASVVPLALLLAGWGGPRRARTWPRLFAYLGLGTVALGGAVLALYAGTGGVNFDLDFLLNFGGSPAVQLVAGIGLLLAAAAWLPLFPLHGWWCDALAEAPVGLAVLLAGAVSRLGGYLLLRVLVGDLHSAAHSLAPWIAGLGALTVVFGALGAIRSADIRRFAAYAALIPGGVTALGVAGLSPLAADGATLELLAGGLAAALLVGSCATIASRAQARSLEVLGGAAPRMPRLAWFLVLGCFGVLGLPGLGSFLGELMALFGSFKAETLASVVLVAGIVLGGAAVASLLYRALFRPARPDAPGISDANLGATWYLGLLAGVLLWVGLIPNGPRLAGVPLFDPGIVNVVNAGAAQLAAPYVPGAGP